MSKKIDEAKTCSVCGTALSGVDESCPVCMLRKGLAGGVESGKSSASEDIVGPTPEPASRRFENYEIVKGEDGIPVELGRGAMGVTYKAFDVDLRCLVTLKVITARYLNDESARLRFLREARAAASVRHPNVASVFHLGRTGENYFYAMEFVEGETLESLIQRSSRLEVKLALEISAQVAAGLAAVHERKLVHRDIKPSNIMVSLKEGNRVTTKIIDLGLSKTVAESSSQPAISMPGAFAGTPEFASPEQFAGVGVDIRSDLYSFGVTLWQMLTGKHPFHGTPAELMYQHQHAPLPLNQLVDVPQPIVVLLQMLLEKDPARRFQNPTELLNALTKVTDAVKARRTITHQSLREIADQQLGASGKAIEILTNLRDVIAVRRVRLILWAALALMIGGGAILTVAILFRPKSAAPPAFRSSSPGITAPEKSIAVLPFENIGANKDDAYFADGVQDEILNNLAKIAQLKVISRTSVMQFRADGKRDLRSVANALGVANILEGAVRRNGNRVRVSTELIDARNDNTIWADSYDRDLTDIFAIQSEVAQTIAGKLTAKLSPDEKNRIETRPTDNLAAYDLYLRANELRLGIAGASILGNVEKTLSEAITLLQEAVRLDPNFTLAYCASAKENAEIYHFADRTPQRRKLADNAINNALRLRPDLPEVHLAYAYNLYWVYRDYQRAKVQLAMARRGLPNDVAAILPAAYMDRRQGNFETAIQDFNEAIARDPRNPESISELGDTFYFTRQFRAAEQAYDRLIELVPDQPMLKVQRADYIAKQSGDAAPVRSALAAVPASMDDDTGVLCWRLRFALYDRDWQRAKEIIDKTNGDEDDGNFVGGNMPVPVGCYSILISRLQGEQPGANASFAGTREQLNQKVQQSPENALLLSKLGVVDALLNDKESAISEAKRAVEMLPISKDAVDGPSMVYNLAMVYAWTNEQDLAFLALGPLTQIPNGIYYGDLTFDQDFYPLRKDTRFNKLLAELAPQD